MSNGKWIRTEEGKRIQRIYVSERYSRFRIKLDEIKIAKGCIDCGYNAHSAALDFDHRDPKTKLFKVAAASSRKWETVLEEIEKCDVRCSNCHRIKHQRKAASDGAQLS